MTDREKLLEKLAKIKAHADSAKEIGSEKEAEEFAEMLQKMLLKHKLEMTDIEFTKMEVDEPVGTHRIDYEKWGVDVKKTRIEWMERLASIVARAHFCRILIHPRSSRVTLVGRKTDAEVAEYMIITLQRAVRNLCGWAYYNFKCECIKRDGNGKASNGFKEAWQKSFIERLAVRYEEEKKAQAGESSMALIRVNKSDTAVAQYMHNYTRFAGSLKPQSAGNMEGTKRGREAADGINLKANAVKGGTTRGELG